MNSQLITLQENIEEDNSPQNVQGNVCTTPNIEENQNDVQCNADKNDMCRIQMLSHNPC